MMWARSFELSGLLLATLASLSLGACTTSPRTALDWDVRDHFTPHTTDQHTVRFEGTVRLPSPQRRVASTRAATTQVYSANLPPVPAARPVTEKPATETSSWFNWAMPSQPQPVERPVQQAEPNVVAQDTPRFRWPVSGRILSSFGGVTGGERNDGINIAAPRGEPIHAAASGIVTYCGNELKGYGNLVLIRHGDGYVTAYAHADSIAVERGDYVDAGQVIGTAGSSGDVNVPQVHFEIRRGVHPVDPRSLLPRSLIVASN
jgi:murein DD-endopeptidase MepM/ murein hydrolase activator NlpD